MATRKCASADCNKPFEAQRPQAKFCSTKCRVRAHRNPTIVAGPIAVPNIATDITAGQAANPGDVTAAVMAELTAAGVESTSLGAQAIQIARRMTEQADTGSAFAALSKELRSVMAQAMGGATQAADPLDELRARRNAKRASAG